MWLIKCSDPVSPVGGATTCQPVFLLCAHSSLLTVLSPPCAQPPGWPRTRVPTHQTPSGTKQVLKKRFKRLKFTFIKYLIIINIK